MLTLLVIIHNLKYSHLQTLVISEHNTVCFTFIVSLQAKFRIPRRISKYKVLQFHVFLF